MTVYPSNPPKNPVVEREPSFGKVFSAFRAKDWQHVALATGLSMPFGWWAGRPVVMAPSMWVAGSIGALYGLSIGFQRSFGRLTGYAENSIEVEKYGIQQPAEATS